MICSECHQNQAEILLKQIVNNQVTQRALCAECAQKLPLLPAADAFLQLLGGLAGLGPVRPHETQSLKCAGCGLSYARFQETGRLGCARCYDSFQGPLSELLQRIHGSDRHKGRLSSEKREPKDEARKQEELRRLQEALKLAVERERFEEAAALRDKIHRLQAYKG